MLLYFTGSWFWSKKMNEGADEHRVTPHTATDFELVLCKLTESAGEF
jgi:hypothetical protein